MPDACGQHATRNASLLSSPLKIKKNFLSDSDEIRLAEYLFEKIKEQNPEHKKPNFQTWAKHVDFMLRLDKRTPERIKQVINWVSNDSFWFDKVLSARKLREKFDELLIRMNNKGQGQPKTRVPKSISEADFQAMVKGK